MPLAPAAVPFLTSPSSLPPFRLSRYVFGWPPPCLTADMLRRRRTVREACFCTGRCGGHPPVQGRPKARPPKLQWIVVSGMFCWCGLSGTCRLSMRRPSFPVRGMTTRSTAPAMAIRSLSTRVLLLWLSRNGKPLCPRRAAVNCNCNVKTFCPLRAAKDHEGPRRRSTATAGKATAERQRQLLLAGPGWAGLAGAYSSSQFMNTGNSRIRSFPSSTMQITG